MVIFHSYVKLPEGSCFFCTSVVSKDHLYHDFWTERLLLCVVNPNSTKTILTLIGYEKINTRDMSSHVFVCKYGVGFDDSWCFISVSSSFLSLCPRNRFLRSTRSAKLERRFPEEAVIWQEPHPAVGAWLSLKSNQWIGFRIMLV